MHFRTATIFLLLIMACGKMETSDRGKRYNSEDIHVENALDLRFNKQQASIMSDEGAWFGFALHQPVKLGFAGPYILDDSNGYWLDEEYIKFKLDINGKDACESFKFKQHSEPGLLVQEIKNDQLYMQLKLFFKDSKHALIDFSIQNLTGTRTELDFHWLTPAQDQRSGFISYNPNKNESNTQRINILSYEHRKIQWVFMFDREDTLGTSVLDSLGHKGSYEENCARWKKRTRVIAKTSNKVLASKCIETLVSNYRSPHGELKYGNCRPSYSDSSNDFETKDDRVRAVALAKVEPDWAKEHVLAMFDQGISEKIAISSLASWAVWNVYEESKDTSFLRKCLQPLTADLQRWNSQYILENELGEHRSRIALNASRHSDIKFLSQIYSVLDRKPNWDLELIAEELKTDISRTFERTEEKYLSDQLGADMIMLLWAGLLSEEQAKSLVSAVMKESSDTHLPFSAPTANPHEPEPMNGLVRFDQAYFALEGMRRYGYFSEAALLQNKLLNSAEGLQVRGPSIRENYHPLTGVGLNARHSSLSAASLLLVITNDRP